MFFSRTQSFIRTFSTPSDARTPPRRFNLGSTCSRARDLNAVQLESMQANATPFSVHRDTERGFNPVQKRARLCDKEPDARVEGKFSVSRWLEVQRSTTSGTEIALINGKGVPCAAFQGRGKFFVQEHEDMMRETGQYDLSYTVDGADIGHSYVQNAMKLFGPCEGVEITHNYEPDHVKSIAHALDLETDEEPLVPRHTTKFKLTKAQRMQVAHLSGVVASSKQRCLSVHLDAASLTAMCSTGLGRSIRRNLTVSRSVRGDGVPQKLQLLVAGPGTGKTAMALATVATVLCGRNYRVFEDNAKKDLTQSPEVCEMHPDSKMMRVAVLVCPPLLIDYWEAAAVSMFDGVDCNHEGAFRATVEGEPEGTWNVKVVKDVLTVRGMLDRPVTSRDGEIWLVAGCTPSSPVLEFIFKRELHYPAMVVYDEGRFVFPASRAGSGCVHEAVPFTLVLTATPADLVENMVSNLRHPLRVAMERYGGSVSSGWRFSNNAATMRQNLRRGELSLASSSISKFLLLRLASGPPELFLNCKNAALASMPAGMTVFRVMHHTLVNVAFRLRQSVDQRPQSSQISVVSTWSALRSHGNAIKSKAASLPRPARSDTVPIESPVELFLERLDELEAEHNALGSRVVDLEWLHANLRPSVDEIERQLDVSFQPGVSETVSLVRNMLEAALAIARLGDECGVCYEPLAESSQDLGTVRAGLTNCCGHVLCFSCLPKLVKPTCPFCRESNFGRFSIVGESSAAAATVAARPASSVVIQLQSASLGVALIEPEHVSGEGTVFDSLMSSLFAYELMRDERERVHPSGLDDAFFLRACRSIQDANVSAFEAVRCAAYLACASRSDVPARVPVFFDFLESNATTAVSNSIKSSVPGAKIFTVEDSGVSLKRFASENSAHPVFLLCNTCVGSTSIAGSDLGNSTAVIVAGCVRSENDETQLLGRFMRMSKKTNRPKIRVFQLCKY
jgi:hypothetical protein